MKYLKVNSVKSVVSEPIIHLTVKKNHNFFAKNICLHNCDFYNNPSNEGEMGLKLHNQGSKQLIIKSGEAMMQGIFIKYLITDDDADTVGGERLSGIGSTSGT